MQDATPFKFLFLTGVEARNLKNVQMIGKQDPYLKLWVGRAGTKVQTRVHDGGGCSATWGESFKFSVERLHAEEYLYFKVKNKNMTDTKTIGSGKVAIKTFGPTMQGKWYKLYDPNGRDAGEILLEGRLSRRGDKNTAMGDHGQDTLNASAGRGAPAGGPTAPMAWGAPGGARPATQQHSSINQPSPAATFPPPRSFAIHYAGSTHHHPGSSPAPSRPSTAVPGHKPSLSVPSAPPQPHYLEQRPSHHGGHHPRRASNAGATTTANMPIAWANRPTTASAANRPTAASAASSYYPGPTAPRSLPTAPAQPGFLGPRSSPYGGPHAYGGPHSYGGNHSHGGPHSYGGPRRLPHGWEEKVASTGRTFYVDHTTKTTSWVRPGEASHGVAR